MIISLYVFKVPLELEELLFYSNLLYRFILKELSSFQGEYYDMKFHSDSSPYYTLNTKIDNYVILVDVV